MYLEFEFLSLVIALESYYDHLVSDPHIMDPDAFTEFRQSIADATPAGPARERVLNLVRSIGNYPPLSTQLEAVTSEYADILHPFIDVDSVVSEATDIRHKLAHGYAEPENDDMMDLLPRLAVIVDTILYHVIGLNRDHIQQILATEYDISVTKRSSDQEPVYS